MKIGFYFIGILLITYGILGLFHIVKEFETKMKDCNCIFFEMAEKGGISHIDINNKGKTGSGFYTEGVKEVMVLEVLK